MKKSHILNEGKMFKTLTLDQSCRHQACAHSEVVGDIFYNPYFWYIDFYKFPDLKKKNKTKQHESLNNGNIFFLF